MIKAIVNAGHEIQTKAASYTAADGEIELTDKEFAEFEKVGAVKKVAGSAAATPEKADK